MQIRSLLGRAVLIAAVAAASGMIAGTAQAAGGQGRTASECATATVKGIPVLNTAMVPESIKSTVTNCSTATETVRLTQYISFADAARGPWARHWRLTIPAGQTVTKWRSFPYTCCGSYIVTDYVHAISGQQLAKASAMFTFA